MESWPRRLILNCCRVFHLTMFSTVELSQSNAKRKPAIGKKKCFLLLESNQDPSLYESGIYLIELSSFFLFIARMTIYFVFVTAGPFKGPRRGA